MDRKVLKTPSRSLQPESKQCKSILKKTESPYSSKKENILKLHVSGGVKSVKFKKSKTVQQARLRTKLNDWLETKGKTPSRYFNLMYFDEQLSAKKKRDRSLPGRLSEDLVGKQEQSLKKEEDLNSRKKLFKDQNKTGISEPTRKFTPTAKRYSNPGISQNPVVKRQGTPGRISVRRRSSTQKADINPFSDKSNESLRFPLTTSSGNQHKEGVSKENESDSSKFTPLKEVSDEPKITDSDIRENLLSMLQECLTLFRAGCPTEHIVSWLGNMELHIPQTQTCALFYACKAEIFNTDPVKMLEVFCQGVENKAEPSQVLTDAMKQLLTPHFSQSEGLSLPELRPSQPYSPFSSQHEANPRISNDQHEATSTKHNLNDNASLPVGYSSDERTPSATKSKTPVKNGRRSQLLFDTSINCTSATKSSSKNTPIKDDSHLGPEGTPQLGSTIKYTMFAATPIPGQSPDVVPRSVVTPVRRSTRLSHRPLTPHSQREIDSVLELTLKEAETSIFFSNPAIENN